MKKAKKHRKKAVKIQLEKLDFRLIMVASSTVKRPDNILNQKVAAFLRVVLTRLVPDAGTKTTHHRRGPHRTLDFSAPHRELGPLKRVYNGDWKLCFFSEIENRNLSHRLWHL